MAGYLALAAVALFAAALLVPRCLLRCREPRAAGTAAVSPVRIPAAGGMAVPAVTAQPRSGATRPFAYDNGLIVGERDS